MYLARDLSLIEHFPDGAGAIQFKGLSLAVALCPPPPPCIAEAGLQSFPLAKK